MGVESGHAIDEEVENGVSLHYVVRKIREVLRGRRIQLLKLDP